MPFIYLEGIFEVCLYVWILDDDKSALEDLTTLLKQNKRHTRAYQSKAIILAKLGKYASGIYNLSHAIVLSPKDPDLYFLRAELYEKVWTIRVSWLEKCVLIKKCVLIAYIPFA